MFTHYPAQSQNDPRPLARPQTVGIWRLTGQIHAGQWCDIYAAQPADAVGSPRSDYAVKIARLPNYEDPEATRQIRIEAAARVRHPNVVPLLDGQLEAARPYLVMPRLEGRTLAQAIEASPPHPLPIALWWARQSAQGLAALHAAGWIHGDLKPTNVMVDPRGHLTLIDLGLAHRIGHGTGNVFRGSPQFSAPEVLNGGSLIHGAVDIYSLGKILEQMLPKTHMPEAVRELLTAMIHHDARLRPTAANLAESLLKLEIETLHLHIQPQDAFVRRAA
ncbi:serine/threonine-protein kinase [Candidatus Laterigemmans baculatus]|uniref:serine/threonine-protein kinase n=1 Tax=Candidatus Laterigemmans baculatus TaxID=2770505 RepID=UPI0013D939C8|nr:serine/threonine-protein kinase [Candidatus Laterigemmans baculatus]